MHLSAETEAARTAARIHGGLGGEEASTLGIRPADVIDFSVSCNPYGPCAQLVDAVRAAAIDRYPDPTARQARAAIAAHLDIDLDTVALGNGACELLWTLARVLVRPGTGTVVVEPTFCEFRAAALHGGGRVHEWRATADDGFAIDLGQVDHLVRACGAAVVYLCSPNTPTGTSVPAGDVAGFAEANPGIVVVLDQSFLSLGDRAEEARRHMPRNVACVRSMTKEHAIPGLRVGYLVAAPHLIAEVERARPAWTTSALAQAAAVAACTAEAAHFVAESRRKLLEDRAHLAELLRRFGHQALPSAACFLLARAGDARRLRDRLLRNHRVLVRDCASFGLPGWVRLAARPGADRDRLEAALTEELGRC